MKILKLFTPWFRICPTPTDIFQVLYDAVILVLHGLWRTMLHISKTSLSITLSITLNGRKLYTSLSSSQSWKNSQVVLGEHFGWLGNIFDQNLSNFGAYQTLSQILHFSWQKVDKNRQMVTKYAFKTPKIIIMIIQLC